MFVSKFCLATVLLSIHLANSYILLTASLDDVDSLVKQIADSPVVNQINDIFRRASSTFQEHKQLVARKHNSETTNKPSGPELKQDPEKPVVRKQLPEQSPVFMQVPEQSPVFMQVPEQRPVQMRSDPKLAVKPQIPSTQKTLPKETTKKTMPTIYLPHPTEGSKLQKDAAPADDNDDIEVWTPDKKALMKELNSQNTSGEDSDENDVKSKTRRTQEDADIAELGRNASFYLTSIKKIFENV
ncbi:hypothetical protein PYW08_006579 [Mythimna loreyi]|uniref:Uncharacterized protein n=1 Tax=Mythimna loreyi TaxID=667449 RepID=A0ACC2QQ02_9NEOP|nr:hypothetical protein PYW08_006579 [Mythimna loreyi]